MATVERFENLKVWKKARELTREVYQECESARLSRKYRYCDQWTAAAVSIMSNIAEGFERNSRKEFLQFLFFAKGSAGEVRSQLYVALDGRLIAQTRFEQLYDMLLDVSRMLAGLIRYLQTNPRRGPRHSNFEL